MSAISCKNPSNREPGYFESMDPAFDEIVSAAAQIDIIAEGFTWSEGPLWIEEKEMLLFSDIPRNSIYKWTAENGSQLYLAPSGYTGTVERGGESGSNGLLLNSKRQLVLCQHGDRQIGLMEADLDDPEPLFKTLAGNYMGKRFDSPNDAVFRSNGDLFFTDPPYGLEKNTADPAKEAPYQGVYKVATNGEVTLLTGEITRPNGIAFFPGEKTIIIACSDPEKAAWFIYDLDENDQFINGRIFYDVTAETKKERGLPDGLKIDARGHIFATGPGGVWVFDLNGKVLGRIRINGVVSNCALADNDQTLFVTAEKYVLKIRLR